MTVSNYIEGYRYIGVEPKWSNQSNEPNLVIYIPELQLGLLKKFKTVERGNLGPASQAIQKFLQENPNVIEVKNLPKVIEEIVNSAREKVYLNRTFAERLNAQVLAFERHVTTSLDLDRHLIPIIFETAITALPIEVAAEFYMTFVVHSDEYFGINAEQNGTKEARVIKISAGLPMELQEVLGKIMAGLTTDKTIPDFAVDKAAKKILKK